MMKSEHDRLMIGMGVDGIVSVQILASESDAETRLRELWTSLRPILEEFFAGMRA